MPSRDTNYSGNAITFNLATQIIESGRGEDTFVEISQQNDDTTYSQGMDGEGVWSDSVNNYAIITLTLMQTAAGNGILSGIYWASKVAGGLSVPVYIEDRNGTSKFASASARILKLPDESYGRAAGTIQWMIGCHDPVRFVGGH